MNNHYKPGDLLKGSFRGPRVTWPEIKLTEETAAAANAARAERDREINYIFDRLVDGDMCGEVHVIHTSTEGWEIGNSPLYCGAHDTPLAAIEAVYSRYFPNPANSLEPDVVATTEDHDRRILTNPDVQAGFAEANRQIEAWRANDRKIQSFDHAPVDGEGGPRPHEYFRTLHGFHAVDSDAPNQDLYDLYGPDGAVWRECCPILEGLLDDAEELDRAYSQGFAAGEKKATEKQNRQDCEEKPRKPFGSASTLRKQVEGLMNNYGWSEKEIRDEVDYTIDHRDETATAASCGESESMFTPDQQAEVRMGSVGGFAVRDVIGRKRLDTLRECEIAATAFAQGADTAQEVADPASPDLVATARDEFDAIMRDFGMLSRGDDHHLIYVRLQEFRSTLPTALQNTPEPDESEAVRLLRELLHEAITLIGRWDALPMGSIPPVELTHNSAKFALRGAIALSNTPEVNDA